MSETGIKALTALDWEPLKKLFPFGDPPYGVVLENGREKEILPWLKLSAEMDPHLIDTYTVAAYWLANHLHKVDEEKTP